MLRTACMPQTLHLMMKTLRILQGGLVTQLRMGQTLTTQQRILVLRLVPKQQHRSLQPTEHPPVQEPTRKALQQQQQMRLLPASRLQWSPGAVRLGSRCTPHASDHPKMQPCPHHGACPR